MKLKALVIAALFLAGLVASVAVAKGPPPGKGKPEGKGKDKGAVVSTGATTTSSGKANKKVWICHRTGSSKNPYRKIKINAKAWPAHEGHGDIALGPIPGSGGSTGTTATTGETSTSVATATGTTAGTGTTTGSKKGKGKSSSGCPSSAVGGTNTGTTSTTP